MSTSYYTLSLDARRRALLTSSYSPRLSDPSQFPVSAILAKLPPLPDTPLLDPPQQFQMGLPTAPPTSPTPDIVPPPVPTTGSPAVNGLGIDCDGDNLPQAQGFESDSGDPQPQAGPSKGDLRPAFKTQPLDDVAASDTGKKKRYLSSRTMAWWTRF